MKFSTVISLIPDLHITMSGKENYPVTGDMISVDQIREIISKFKGLPLYAGCFEKAKIAQEFIPGADIIVGAMRILSKDRLSMYGYDFKPPLESHSWLMVQNKIIDFALPGTILRGLKERDEIGPFLIGREPIIIIGTVPDWVFYKPVHKIKFI